MTSQKIIDAFHKLISDLFWGCFEIAELVVYLMVILNHIGTTRKIRMLVGKLSANLSKSFD